MFRPVRSGEVAQSMHTLSNTVPRRANSSTAWSSTSSREAESVASSAGRRNAGGAPCSAASPANSGESVDTRMSVNSPESLAWSTV